MSSHLKCALTHVVFGVLLFVMGIVDLGVNYGEYWTGFRVFVLVCGVWVGKLRYFASAVNERKIRLHTSAYITCKGEKVRSELFLAVCTLVHS